MENIKWGFALSLLVLPFSALAAGANGISGPTTSVVPNMSGMPSAAGVPANSVPSGSSVGTGAGNASAITPSYGKAGEARKVDVDLLKKKYWEYNTGNPLSVVQNRTYTKSNRMNLRITGGNLSDDPFLNSWTYGLLIGYNFSENLAVNLLYTRVTNSTSQAYNTFYSASGYGADTNPVSAIYGGEVDWSILYGKLSVLGLAIIHFDLYLLGGAGLVTSQNGSYFAPWIGIGEQLFLSHSISLSVDYRQYYWYETIVEEFNTNTSNGRPTIGQTVGQRNNFAGAFTLGLNFFLF